MREKVIINEVGLRDGLQNQPVIVGTADKSRLFDALVRAGVRGIVNFAPVQLKVPPGIFLEQLDITLSIEKVAYFARKNSVKEQLR